MTKPFPADYPALLKRAYVSLEKLQSRIDGMQQERTEPIAVIGMACRFPGGASTPEAFWHLLHDGVDGIREVPPDRWNIDEFFDPDPDAPGKMYSRHGGFLEDIAGFDPELFGISPREAAAMDPQQRLLLEVSWEALEDAGHLSASLAGSSTGVFAGLCVGDYGLFGIAGAVDRIDAYSGTGVSHSVAAGRIAYALGLRGPTLAVDTACSSSLVALHLACQSLRNGECRMALAGGANLVLAPGLTVCFCKLRALAPDGRCKSFDASADGYVRGEGCGMVVLKRLSDAIADHDHILAVIRGSAINHDGPSGGLTVPNGLAQQAVIRQALANAGVRAAEVGFIEAHGTGTALGDPIEVRALGAVLAAADGASRGPVWLGSVKTNIGHLEGAAGIAGFIKAVLTLRHGEIPPNLHFRERNPRVEWDGLPFAVPTQVVAWNERGKKRVAGVSSFGFSGTNAHIVLQEAPDVKSPARAVDRSTHLLCLSAGSAKALDELTARYVGHLGAINDSLADICFTANSGRMHLAHRLAAAAASIEEMLAKLQSGAPRAEMEPGQRARLAGVFTTETMPLGHGADLYETQPAFREALQACEQASQPWLTHSLLRWMFESRDPGPQDDRYLRAGIFAMQYALWRMWQSWGVSPATVSGDGANEYAAARAAGVYSLKDALQLAATVGREPGNPRRHPPSLDVVPGGRRRLQQEGYTVFLELGPHRAGWPKTMESLAAMYLAGIEIDWAATDRGFSRCRVSLPTYPFQRERYWASASSAAPKGTSGTHPFLGSQVPGEFQQRRYERRFRATSDPWIRDHRVYDAFVFPAAGYFEMALEAATDSFGEGPYALEGVSINEPLVLPESGETSIRTCVVPQDADTAQFDIETDAARHTSGRIRSAGAEIADTAGLAELAARCPTPLSASEYYEAIAKRHIHLGASYRRIMQLTTGAGEAFCSVEPGGGANPGWRIDPGVIDACLQLLGVARADRSGDAAYVPIAVDRLVYSGLRTPPAHAHAVLRFTTAESFVGDFQLFDATGQLLAKGRGVRFIRVSGSSLGVGRPDLKDCFYNVEWRLAQEITLAHPSDIVAEVGPRAAVLGQEHGLDRYSDLSGRLEVLSADFARAALRRLGWNPETHGTESGDALAERLGVAISQRRLFGRILEIVGEDAGRAPADPEQVWQALLARYPDCETELELIGRCGRKLADVLTGRQDPVEVLFPKGSLSALEKLYQTSPFALVWNLLAAEAIERALRDLPAGRTLRILEIGGGTGATTSYILPRLDPARTEYVFTDVSPLFTAAVEQKFQTHGFVRYALLDIERAPAEQGFEAHTFDVVIAANVLHATRDLGETVRNVRAMLAPEGLLLLLEGIRKERWIDLVFGLTEGWWRFTDKELRPSHPLISERNWIELLQTSGYVEAAAISGSSSASQAVVLARAAPEPVGSWLIVGEPDAFTNRLALLLESRGGACRIAREYTQEGRPPLRGVIHAGSLAGDSQAAGCYNVLEVVKALARLGQPPRLWLVTRGAQSPDSGPVPAVAHATIWGLAKVIAIEHPELRCAAVDLDPAAAPVDSAADLLRELLGGADEREIAFRAGGRFVSRLIRVPRVSVPEGPYELATTERGILDNLVLRPAAGRAPAEGEIQIEVSTTGLNFLDVMDASGVLPFERGGFGAECAGTVVAVGKGVMQFQPGDSVIALAHGSFSRLVTTRAAFAVVKPEKMTFDEAASVPVAFLTAHFTLHALARISTAEKILIHAAAGGVGLAAVQLAKNAGAEIFATAGTPEKRAFLTSLGVDHVLDSRSLLFAGEIQRLTGGEGVDIVLNSLAGEFIPASIGILKPQGRFVEIGKTGIWDAHRFAELKPDASYFVYDLARQALDRPAEVADALQKVTQQFRDGVLRPLPLQRFPIEQITDAFRYMAQGRQIGKIVVTHRTAVEMRSDASYLITGGLGGLGLLVARWLAERGARHLILVGRSAPTPQAAAAVADLERMGVRVKTARADVANYDELARIFAGARASMPPLRGVIHSAGILNDGVLMQQDAARFASVFTPKVDGSWNLHRLTRETPLDFFVLFASAAAVWGSPGQANHAAANAFQDALAYQRRAESLPAISIDWGPWSHIGAAAERNVGQNNSVMAVANISPDEGLRALERILHDSPSRTVVARVKWREFKKQFGAAARQPFYAEVMREDRRAKPDTAPITAPAVLFGRVSQALPGERSAVVFEFVHSLAVRVLGVNASRKLNPRQPLNELGLDSLMALELRNSLAAAAGCSLPATLLFDYPTLETVTAFLLQEIAGGLPPSAPVAVNLSEELPDKARAEVEQLSEDEAEESLIRELDHAGY